jgi:hypothetical protein
MNSPNIVKSSCAKAE